MGFYCSPTNCSSLIIAYLIQSSFDLTGIILFYVFWQLCLWRFFHITAVFFGVSFPFYMQSFQKSTRSKYLCVGLTLAGIVIPVLPVTIIASIDDFTIPRWPPINCISRSSDVIFYAVILPITLSSAVALTMILFIVKEIAKVYKTIVC